LRRKPPSTSDVWYLDEVVMSIGGRKHWLWRTADQDGYVLDEIVQARRNTKAARRLLVRLMKKQASLPKRIVTDKLRSYGAARRQIMPAGGRASIAQGVEQPRRKLAPAAAKAGEGHAAISLARRVATFRKRLLRGPKSLRPCTVQMLSHRRPPAPPQSDRTLEGSGWDSRMIASEPAGCALVPINLTSPKKARPFIAPVH
jgi:putative transposase